MEELHFVPQETKDFSTDVMTKVIATDIWRKQQGAGQECVGASSNWSKFVLGHSAHTPNGFIFLQSDVLRWRR